MDDDILKEPIAKFLYEYRIKHNLVGDNKEDWKHAGRVLIDLQTEDELRREFGKTLSYNNL